MARGRHGARRLVLQALYQRQLGGHSESELVAQFSVKKEYRGVDSGYFLALLAEILPEEESLDALITESADRPV